MESLLAAIVRVRASLRVFGDRLEPEEVSALLGCEPTCFHRKGDKVTTANLSLIEPTGAWILESPLDDRSEIEDHVEALLAAVTNDSDEWASLTSRFSASILCRVAFERRDGGFEVSPRLAHSLAERGLVIAFEVELGEGTGSSRASF